MLSRVEQNNIIDWEILLDHDEKCYVNIIRQILITYASSTVQGGGGSSRIGDL